MPKWFLIGLLFFITPLFLLVLFLALYLVCARVSMQPSSGYADAYQIANILTVLFSWIVVLLGALFAFNTLQQDALAKLHDIHDSPEYADAAWLLWALDSANALPNPYTVIRESVNHLRSNSPDTANMVDKARRLQTRFWYRAALLTHYRIVSYHDIFQNFGSPEIVKVLEPLETILAEKHDRMLRRRSRQWPPMRLLIEWFKHKGYDNGWLDARPTIPARQKLYEDSLNN